MQMRFGYAQVMIHWSIVMGIEGMRGTGAYDNRQVKDNLG